MISLRYDGYGLYYSPLSKLGFVDYVATGYLFDSHNGQSQTSYVFIYGFPAISWRSTKQTIEAISSNHPEILAIQEASR